MAWSMAVTDQDVVGDVAQVMRLGRCASVNLAERTCTVAYGDPDGDDAESADIPWGGFRAGRMRVWSPPTVGEQGMLFAPGGDIAQAVFVPGLYSTEFPAPGDAAREFITFDDGAEFGYDPDSHEADVTLPGGGKLTIVAPGGVQIQGDVEVQGQLTASVDVIADGISLKTHTHGNVQAGAAHTGAPE